MRGQQAGSLACTDLGYWVVFDSIGLALNCDFDFGLVSIASRLGRRGTVNQNNLLVNNRDREAIRRPYGYVFSSPSFTFLIPYSKCILVLPVSQLSSLSLNLCTSCFLPSM